MDLDILTKQIVSQMRLYHQRMGTKSWDYQIAAKDLPCQVGSLLKLIMQLNGERYAHGKSAQMIKAEIADELADILSLVVFIAHELNIDLGQAWSTMLKSDEQKFDKRFVEKE